jgi:hypothetical protein
VIHTAISQTGNHGDTSTLKDGVDRDETEGSSTAFVVALHGR